MLPAPEGADAERVEGRRVEIPAMRVALVAALTDCAYFNIEWIVNGIS